MKARVLAMLSLLVVPSSFAQLPYTQEQVIAYAKSIDVHTLDPSLLLQRLEDWLQTPNPYRYMDINSNARPRTVQRELTLIIGYLKTTRLGARGSVVCGSNLVRNAISSEADCRACIV